MTIRLGRRWIPVAIALAALARAAHADPTLIGVSFADGLVYDVDAQTGAATNPRQVWGSYPCTDCPGALVALSLFVGIEVAGDGSLLLATSQAATYHPSTVFSVPNVPPLIANASFAAGQQIGECDLALDPVSGDLFAVGLTNLVAPFTLLRIDLSTSTTTVVGEIGTSDVSGLAFDASGTLYALDTGADTLLVLDPSDASTLSTTALSEPLGALAGMDFDPATGTLYVADGGAGGQDALFTLDPATGALTEVGPLGIANGLSGLAVPEPQAAALAAAAFASLASVAARRR